MLTGMMMERQLTIGSIIDHASRVFPDTTIVSAAAEGARHSYTYGAASLRIGQLANTLTALGVRPGDRVATLAWNGFRHFELYYAIAGIGAVCHTLNPRLPAEQLAYIIGHAGDRVLFFDPTLAALVAQSRSAFPDDLRLVVMADGLTGCESPELADVIVYEQLLANAAPDFPWPEVDERAAAGLCYTSGTTGAPKGVLYSHRSSVLHALSVIAAGTEGLRPGSVILPVVPLFHANAWGLPHAAPLVGASLVLPGPRLDGPSLFGLMDRERVTSAWGVPTVWVGLIEEMRRMGRKPEGLAEVIVGGSAAPAAMIEAFEREFGVCVVHGWGMTETSPVGTLCTLPVGRRMLTAGAQIDTKLSQGRPLFGVELKIVEDGERRAHDGKAVGELYVRGHSVTAGYFANPAATATAFDAEGWFKTGDVARIAPDGFLQIVDRVKDLIKSGGEWISSIDVENAALSLPGVAMCAVIAIAHDKWGERPLLLVVKREGSEVTRDEIIAGLASRLTKWQVPDEVLFVDTLPMTATGKVSKLKLREQLTSQGN